MDYNLVHCGWKKEGTSDKVWGVITLKQTYTSNSPSWWGDQSRYNFLVFWGRRGKKLQFLIKEDKYLNVMGSDFQKKLNKGYQKINKNELDEVYPEFEQDLDAIGFIGILKM